MFCLLSLPSVELSQLSKLPSIPSVYLACIGSSVLYVGKALDLKSRHNEERHHLYGFVRQLDKERRSFVRLRWIDFSNITVSELSQGTILLGFEECLIRHFQPQWNSRLNGVRLNQFTIEEIMSQLVHDEEVQAIPLLQTVKEISPSRNMEEDAKRIAREHAAKRRITDAFNKGDWNLCDCQKTKELVAELNSFSSKQLTPACLIQIGLMSLAELLRGKGLPVEAGKPNLTYFMPIASTNPKLQAVAETIIDAFPDLSLAEFILRCTGKDVSQVNPVDYAILSIVHTKAQPTHPQP